MGASLIQPASCSTDQDSRTQEPSQVMLLGMEHNISRCRWSNEHLPSSTQKSCSPKSLIPCDFSFPEVLVASILRCRSIGPFTIIYPVLRPTAAGRSRVPMTLSTSTRAWSPVMSCGESGRVEKRWVGGQPLKEDTGRSG